MEVAEFNRFVGMDIDKASIELPKPFFFFVVNNNGKTIYRTWEFNPKRICIWVENNIITKIDSIN